MTAPVAEPTSAGMFSDGPVDNDMSRFIHDPGSGNDPTTMTGIAEAAAGGAIASRVRTAQVDEIASKSPSGIANSVTDGTKAADVAPKPPADMGVTDGTKAANVSTVDPNAQTQVMDAVDPDKGPDKSLVKDKSSVDYGKGHTPDESTKGKFLDKATGNSAADGNHTKFEDTRRANVSNKADSLLKKSEKDSGKLGKQLAKKTGRGLAHLATGKPGKITGMVGKKAAAYSAKFAAKRGVGMAAAAMVPGIGTALAAGMLVNEVVGLFFPDFTVGALIGKLFNPRGPSSDTPPGEGNNWLPSFS